MYLRIVCLLILAQLDSQAAAVEITDMKSFEELYGRYAPQGDCNRQPRVIVDPGGITLDLAAEKVRVTNAEFAASFFGGASEVYDGISKVFFPFRSKPDYYPIMMTFNADEKEGTLTIVGHEEGWKGGPALTPRNQALVSGSPYARCR